MLAVYVAHFGEAEDAGVNLLQHVLRLAHRDAVWHLHEDRDVAFVQFGQEFGADPVHRQRADRQQPGGGRERQRSALQNAVEQAPVAQPQSVDPRRLDDVGMFGLEQHRAECRHDRQRECQRPGQGEGVGERERAEKAPLHRLQREHRQQRRDDDEHGKEDRSADVGRGDDDELQNVLARRRSLRRDPVHHGLDQHDGPIDDDAEIDRPHRDQIGGQPEQAEADEGGQ